MHVKALHERETLTVSETADLLGVSERAVQKACKRGDLPANRKMFRVWCIDLVALRERLPEQYEQLAKKHAAKIAGRCIYCGR